MKGSVGEGDRGVGKWH